MPPPVLWKHPPPRHRSLNDIARRRQACNSVVEPVPGKTPAHAIMRRVMRNDAMMEAPEWR
jgi:hypothetical protein